MVPGCGEFIKGTGRLENDITRGNWFENNELGMVAAHFVQRQIDEQG